MNDENDCPALFAVPEDDAPGAVPSPAAAWKVLVVDDDEDVHQVTTLVLRDFAFDGRGLEFLHARSGAEALALFERHSDIAVALVDVVMETEEAGLDVVRQVRERLGNKFVRLILRTGQPGVAPEREVITRYDINDYKAKAELSSLRLYSTMMAALRGYRDIMALDHERRGMARMVEAASALFRARFVPAFAEIALVQLDALLEIDIAVAGGGALYADGLNGTILAATGSYAELGGHPLTDAAQPLRDRLAGVTAYAIDDRDLAIRLELRYGAPHFIHAWMARVADATDRCLIELFRLKAIAALDNLLLLDRSRSAQRQAILALARLAPRPANTTLRFGMPSPTVRTLPRDGARLRPMDAEYVDFPKELAIQAEVADWGTDGAAAHVERIGRFAAQLAARAGMAADFCGAIGRAAELHDVGKIFAPPSGSTGWYEPDRGKRGVAAQHALLGGEFLQGAGEHAAEIMRMAADIALCHHEAWNGTGYPKGLKGRAIPLAARIVGLVVFFDACVHPVGWDGERMTVAAADAFDLVGAASGFYFDPELVRTFLANRRDFAD